jgi:glycine C-acetyltransferase
VALQYATFSKSFAGGGGFVSGSRELLRYMRYYANNYGFSCALPPSVVGGLLAALHVATRDDSLRVKLWDNVAYFRERARGIGLDLGDSTSQVFPIIIGGDRRALYEMALAMHERGLFLAPVDYPSVPDDSLRYRVAITAAHTRVDLDEALQILEDVVIARIGRKR